MAQADTINKHQSKNNQMLMFKETNAYHEESQHCIDGHIHGICIV